MNENQSLRQSEFGSLLNYTVMDRIFSEPAAADYLGMSYRTLGRWHANGADPASITLGEECVCYPQSDLTAYVEANRVKSAAKVRHG